MVAAESMRPSALADPRPSALPLYAPFDPAFRADPYPGYARLRREAPVYWSELGDRGCWVVSRFTDCLAVLRSPDMGMRRPGPEAPPELQDGPAARIYPRLLIFNDPPDHGRLRRLVSKAFTPRAVETLRPRIHRIVNQLLDAVADRRRMDLMADFAFQVPVLVICELLGVPTVDRQKFKRWTPDFSLLFEPDLLDSESLARCDAATASLVDYFEDLISVRRRCPEPDLLSALIEVSDGGDRLAREELIAMAVQLLNAGYETTMGLIGNGALALLQHPDELARLRAEPSLIDAAVEECLRFDSPVQLSGRIARDDVTLRDVEIEAGDLVITLLGSANRDPAAFERADRFEIRRPPAHLAFGFGSHFCLGAHLARLEARIALGTLVRRLPRLEIATRQLPRRPSMLFRVLERLPVVF
jgi:cytochrome P450